LGDKIALKVSLAVKWLCLLKDNIGQSSDKAQKIPYLPHDLFQKNAIMTRKNQQI